MVQTIVPENPTQGQVRDDKANTTEDGQHHQDIQEFDPGAADGVDRAAGPTSGLWRQCRCIELADFARIGWRLTAPRLRVHAAEIGGVNRRVALLAGCLVAKLLRPEHAVLRERVLRQMTP
jgi:hypothetical protein